MKRSKLLKILGILLLGYISLIIISYYGHKYNIDRSIIHCLVLILGLISGWQCGKYIYKDEIG